MDKDIRWKQRFENFEKAFQLFAESAGKDSFTELERAGLVQFFEFTFELGWKTLKDLLQERGVEVKYPKDVLKEAFRYGLIEDGDAWMDMLKKRNLLSHTYDDDRAELAHKLILASYLPAIEQVYKQLKAELS